MVVINSNVCAKANTYTKNLKSPLEIILPHCSMLSLVTCRSLNVNATTIYFPKWISAPAKTSFLFRLPKKKSSETTSYLLKKFETIKKESDHFSNRNSVK